MKRIILASNNKNKLKELREKLEEFDIEVISQKEAGIDLDVEENGSSFKENAEIKAKAIYDILKIPVIADDSGLCVDYLNGAPGIYSHRYAGENANDDDRINKLLRELENIEEEKRTCHFTCSICYIDENGNSHFFEDYLYGKIGFSKKGENGFGYDPIVVLENGKHVAELTSEEKNEISHRGKAIRKFMDYIK